MTDWWESTYPGGAPVKVDGFPRPLYPPDAEQHGKEPSSRGPDVIAYKRAVSRLGRWPWQTFDDKFWDDFAHGEEKPKSRKTSGLAGVQFQQHIDATGWLGKQTFSMLLHARVPEGLNAAGQPAFDAKAIALLNDAYEMFGGHEAPPPPPPMLGTTPGKSVRLAALARARSQLGVSESPAGSNRNKYGDWYGMNGVPWCAIFCTWCFELGARDVGTDSPAFVKGSRYAYVPYVVGDARNRRNGLRTTDDPIPGDLVCYDWGWDAEHDHIGIFERWSSPTGFDCIEGNTSTSNNSNGGQVMRRTRSRSGQGTVFVRVAEPA